MKFVNLKGLFTSALFFTLCVKAQEYTNGCNKIKSIAYKCEEDHYGYVTGLDLESKADVEKNVFSNLKDLEKLTIDGLQDKLKQYHFDEIATLPGLKEVHLSFTDISESDEKLDMSVLNKLEKLTYLDLTFYRAGDINVKGFNSLKKLDLSECDPTQTIINDIGNLKNLEDLTIEIDNETKKLDFSPIKKNKKITTLKIIGTNDKHEHQKELVKNTLKGFTNVKNLSLERIKFSQSDIDDLSELSQIEELKFYMCDWDDVSIEPLNKLPKLKSVDFSSNYVIKGKTLTNASLEKCLYDTDAELCIAKDMKCLTKEVKEAYKPCDSGADSDSKVSTDGKCGAKYGTKCPSGECCSKHGWCGKSKDYCGAGCQSEFGKCNATSSTTTIVKSSTSTSTKTKTSTKSSLPTSTNDRCGAKFGTQCPSGECCSKHGWCGKSDEHCGAGCQSEFGKCNGTSAATTTTTTIKSTTTKTKTSTKKSSTTTKSSLPTSTNDRCGAKFGTQCPSGECCSKHGWCGKSDDHCGAGCQSEFGKCNGTATTKAKTSTKKSSTNRKSSTTTKSSVPTSTDDRCGAKFGTKCPSGKCCSKHGWCGKSDEHCGAGCQSEFGKCN